MPKRYEQTFSTEIFPVAKFIQRLPQPVYELTDLQDRSIEGQFYNYEFVNVTFSPKTEIEIDKLVRTCNKNGINQYFANWRG